MKHIKNILIISLACICLSNAQNDGGKISKVIYKKGRYNVDDVLNRTKNSKYKDVFVQQIKAFETIEYQLLFNKKESEFKIIDKMTVKEEIGYKIALIVGGGMGIYYKNLESKEKIKADDGLGDWVNVMLPFNEYEWTITKEEKKIGKYTCYKAVSHKTEFDKARNKTLEFSPVVWFTPEIPAPFGPSGLDGLPGLVLEGTINGTIYFYATSIALDPDDKKHKIKKPKKGKTVTEAEYAELIYKNSRYRRNR